MSAVSFLRKERCEGEGSEGDGEEQDHVNHYILDPCIRLIDHEALDRVIQTAICFKSNEEEIMAATYHWFSKQSTC